MPARPVDSDQEVIDTMNETIIQRISAVEEQSSLVTPELVGKIDGLITSLMEGASSLRLLQDGLQDENEKRMRLQLSLEQMAQENIALRAKIRELEMPWWRRFFRPRLNAL